MRSSAGCWPSGICMGFLLFTVSIRIFFFTIARNTHPSSQLYSLPRFLPTTLSGTRSMLRRIPTRLGGEGPLRHAHVLFQTCLGVTLAQTLVWWKTQSTVFSPMAGIATVASSTTCVTSSTHYFWVSTVVFIPSCHIFISSSSLLLSHTACFATNAAVPKSTVTYGLSTSRQFHIVTFLVFFRINQCTP